MFASEKLRFPGFLFPCTVILTPPTVDGPAVVAFIITPFVLPIGFIIGHAATQVYGYSLTNMFISPIVMLGSGYIGKEMVMVTPAEIIIIS